jgi:hypothetical protein
LAAPGTLHKNFRSGWSGASGAATNSFNQIAHGVNTPCRPTGLRAYHTAMSKRFLCHPRSTGAQPPPDSNQTAIAIEWIEGAGITIEIQLRHVGLAKKCCDIKWRQNCRQVRGTRLAFEVGAQKLFVSKSRRLAS